MKNFFKKAKVFLAFFVNPRLLLCFCLGWMLTNGWAYILLAVGSMYGIAWMTAISGAYLAILWLPISPEKVITIALAITFMKMFFPRDEKTLGKLIAIKKGAIESVKKIFKKFKKEK